MSLRVHNGAVFCLSDDFSAVGWSRQDFWSENQACADPTQWTAIRVKTDSCSSRNPYTARHEPRSD